ncbi:MAG: beta-ketoacyl synthase N-terminal-like domain-containing protein [Sulfitobacter sp.]
MKLFLRGLSAVSPLGVKLPDFWENLMARNNAFRLHKGPNACDTNEYLASRIEQSKINEMAQYLRERRLIGAREEVCVIYALYACIYALEDAGIDWQNADMRKTAIVLGNLEPNSRIFDIEAGQELPNSNSGEYRIFQSGRIAQAIADAIGAEGPALTIHNTCASGNAALEYGARLIRQGVVTTAVVGGADAFSDRIFSGFSTLGVLGQMPCSPFSIKRKYITISEGAAVAVLTSQDSATDVDPIAELVAAVSNNDAKHPTNPSKDGVLACHQKLWKTSGISPSEIDFVFAHGTGSRANDAVEAAVFGDNYEDAAIYALKGMTGHLMGAAGAIGLVASCMSAQKRILPPNQIIPDDLEYSLNLSNEANRRDPESKIYAQNNAFGFGGSNSISLFRSV